MNEALLQRWLRGDLPAQQRREVSRWIVRCTSPELAPLLHGMLQHQRDEAADAATLTRFPSLSSIVTLWHRLLTQGKATLHSGEEALVLAALELEVQPVRIALERLDDRVVARIELTKPGDQTLLLLRSSDDGAIERIARISPPLPTLVRVELGPAATPRLTLWVALSKDPPTRDDPQEELLAQPDGLMALRWAGEP